MFGSGFDPTSVNLSVEEMLQVFVAVIFIISGLLAVLYSIWGGFLLITSGGNEEKVKPAINYIRHALLGLIVLVIIIFTAPKALALFGLPFADDMRVGDIFETMKKISAYIFNTPIDAGGSESIDTNSELPADFSDL